MKTIDQDGREIETPYESELVMAVIRALDELFGDDEPIRAEEDLPQVLVITIDNGHAHFDRIDTLRGILADPAGVSLADAVLPMTKRVLEDLFSPELFEIEMRRTGLALQPNWALLNQPPRSARREGRAIKKSSPARRRRFRNRYL